MTDPIPGSHRRPHTGPSFFSHSIFGHHFSPRRAQRGRATMSRATADTPDAPSKEITSWNWKSTIQGAVRRVIESVASSHPPWIPDNTCTAAISVLFEALQHDRDHVMDALLNGLKSIELPVSLSTMDSRLRLHQALCMSRVISSCVFHD